MGATGWHYTTQYDPDANAARQRLRQEVFEAGRYGDSFANASIWNQPYPIALKLIVFTAKCYCVVSSLVGWVIRGFRGPRTIEEALAIAAESGTHSILDIERCSQTPSFSVAWQLQPSRLRELFGTDRPTLADLERVGWGAVMATVRRWEAVYFSLYKDNQPVLLVFIGVSGD